MSEDNSDVFTTQEEATGPDSFGGDEFRLPSEEWLVEGFERNLKAIQSGQPITQVKTASRGSFSQTIEDDSSASLYEQAIMEIDQLRDDLISVFHKNKDDKVLFNLIESLIHRVEKTIRTLGGEVDDFDPLAHMSGLESSPEANQQDEDDILLTNAKRVVGNTEKHYKIHKVLSIQPKTIKGKPGVVLQIVGEDEKGPFRVVGAVVAKDDFLGNEAIDYVRHEGKGCLSVKSFKNGKWQDSSNDFHLGIEDRPSQNAPLSK